MNMYIQEQEFAGNPEICTISPTSLDLSEIALKANDCLSNSGKIAQKYDFCTIVEGVLFSKDIKDGGVSLVRHAWNYDTRTKTYFDTTIRLVEIKNNTVGKFEYKHFKCFEYTLDYALKYPKLKGFQYSYNNLIGFIKSKIEKQDSCPRKIPNIYFLVLVSLMLIIFFWTIITIV
jgi:hypothetical protein